MVIWFNNEKARKHLLEKGFVYTVRPPSKRTHGIRKLGREPLFWNEYKKKGIVNVSFLWRVESRRDLRHFVFNSGFKSIEEWINQGIEFPAMLYKVELVNLGEKQEEGLRTQPQEP